MNSSLLIALSPLPLLFLGAIVLRNRLAEHLSFYWGWFKYLIGFGPSFIIPDMVSHCKYPVHVNPYCEEQSRTSMRWFADIAHLSEKEEARHVAVNFGYLMSLIAPYADARRLRVTIDWMNYIFWLDDLLETSDMEAIRKVEEYCMDAMRDPVHYQKTDDPVAAIVTKSLCSRMEEASSTAFKERYMDSMRGYFQGVYEQVEARIQNRNLGIEEYLAIRWHSIAVAPGLLMADFCRGTYLPDYVHNHPTFNLLRRAAGEHIICVNDIISYDRESREDPHNFVCVVMRTKGCNLQEAMGFVGQRANECIDRFEHVRQRMPSWGPEVDKMVADFTAGYEYWMSGHLHWSLSSERYFGDIKNTWVVKLRYFWHPIKYEAKS